MRTFGSVVVTRDRVQEPSIVGESGHVPGVYRQHSSVPARNTQILEDVDSSRRP